MPPPLRSGPGGVTGTQIWALREEAMRFYSLALAANASVVASGSTCGTVGIWDVKSGARCGGPGLCSCVDVGAGRPPPPVMCTRGGYDSDDITRVGGGGGALSREAVMTE